MLGAILLLPGVAFALSFTGILASPAPVLAAIGPLLVCLDRRARARILHIRYHLDLGILCLGLFLLLAFLSLLWSQSEEYGSRKLGLLIAKGIAPGLAAGLLKRDPNEPFSRGLAALFWAYCLAVFLFGTINPLYPGRVTLGEQNPIWVARSCVLGGLLSALLPGLWFPARIAGLGLGISAAFLTGSRGPILSLSVVLIVVVLSWIVKREQVFRLGMAGLASAAAAVVLLPIAGSVLNDSRFVRPLRTDPNSVDRLERSFAAFDLALSNPILGVGIGGFATGERSYPHNLILEIFAEEGIVGLLLWLGFIAAAFRKATLRESCLLLLSILFSLTSGDLSENFEQFLIGAFILFGNIQIAPVNSRLEGFSRGSHMLPRRTFFREGRNC